MRKRKNSWWDSICSGCGQCCCDKIKMKKINKKKQTIAGTKCINRRWAIDFSSPCVYLDIETGGCSIYKERFTVCRNCIPLTIFHALFAGYLPPNCSYVKKFRFWKNYY